MRWSLHSLIKNEMYQSLDDVGSSAWNQLMKEKIHILTNFIEKNVLALLSICLYTEAIFPCII